MERICIYPKDVQVVTGKSERWGREIIKKIKTRFSKQDHQLVTIDEFCTYLGLEENKANSFLGINNTSTRMNLFLRDILWLDACVGIKTQLNSHFTLIW
ncbi:MAG: hypothetical protein U0T77_10415 [Chitinophagales bacterium]